MCYFAYKLCAPLKSKTTLFGNEVEAEPLPHSEVTESSVPVTEDAMKAAAIKQAFSTLGTDAKEAAMKNLENTDKGLKQFLRVKEQKMIRPISINCKEDYLFFGGEPFWEKPTEPATPTTAGETTARPNIIRTTKPEEIQTDASSGKPDVIRSTAPTQPTIPAEGNPKVIHSTRPTT